MTDTTEQEDKRAEAEAHKEAHDGEDPSANVAIWLHETRAATLSTLAVKPGIEGFPIGSIVPFAVDGSGRPFILVASIAAHTRNIDADPRASLFISDPEAKGDPQSSWRASLLGEMRHVAVEGEEVDLPEERIDRVTPEEHAHLLARYVERVPAAESYVKVHNFSFYRMSTIERIRYIAGFGRICWIPGRQYMEAVADTKLAEAAPEAIEHMNDDHVDAMVTIVKGHRGIDVESVNMVELDSNGMMLETHQPHHLMYVSFESRITAESMRTEIINSVVAARKAIG
jgi:putative heme iron utilization protein